MSVIIVDLTEAAVCKATAYRVLRNHQRWRETGSEEKELLTTDTHIII